MNSSWDLGMSYESCSKEEKSKHDITKQEWQSYCNSAEGRKASNFVAFSS